MVNNDDDDEDDDDDEEPIVRISGVELQLTLIVELALPTNQGGISRRILKWGMMGGLGKGLIVELALSTNQGGISRRIFRMGKT